jgi:hypothetical protein
MLPKVWNNRCGPFVAEENHPTTGFTRAVTPPLTMRISLRVSIYATRCRSHNWRALCDATSERITKENSHSRENFGGLAFCLRPSELHLLWE